MNKIKLVISSLIFCNLISCIENNSIRIDKDILNGWDIEESIKFEIKDTIDFPSNISFYIRNNKYELKEGDIMLFPSTFIFNHEVKTVTKGERYSFVSWAY